MNRLLGILLVWFVLGGADAAPSRPLYVPPEPPSPAPLVDLQGSTWGGTTFNRASIVVTFQKDGRLIYHPDRGVPGSWSVEENRVYFEINNKASEHRGIITGDVIEGTSTNQLQNLKSPLSLQRVPP